MSGFGGLYQIMITDPSQQRSAHARGHAAAEQASSTQVINKDDLRPGDLVVMDNLSPHKNAQTLQLITQVGAEVRFLPAYSPDLNPIEKMWSKVKQFLRSAEARDWENLQAAIV